MELFGILSMTTMHSWQRIKPLSLLPNHHQGAECGLERNYSGLGVDKERKISSGDKRDNRIQGVMDRGQSLTEES